MTKWIEMGRTAGPYGVKGWIRISPAGEGDLLLGSRAWAFRPAAGGDPRPLELEGARAHGGMIIAKWKGCDSPEEARLWRGTILLERSAFPELPEGEWWAADLEGCEVVNRAGDRLGTVTGLGSNGAQDILQVKGAAHSYLIPMVPAYLLGVEPEKKLITVDWDPDWF